MQYGSGCMFHRCHGNLWHRCPCGTHAWTIESRATHGFASEAAHARTRSIAGAAFGAVARSVRRAVGILLPESMWAEVVEVAGLTVSRLRRARCTWTTRRQPGDDSPGRRRVRYLPTWAGGFELNVRWSRAGAADSDPVSGGAARGQTRGTRGDSSCSGCSGYGNTP